MVKKRKEGFIMSKTFERKDDYSEKTLRDVKKLLDASREIGMDVIAIPNIKTIICYYSGYPFVEINDNDWKWKGFKSYADKHFNDVSDEIKDIIRGDNKNLSYKSFLLNPENDWDNLKIILKGVSKAQFGTVERRTQHFITNNNINFNKDVYSVCGFETKIGRNVCDGKSPKIDLVLFCPKKNSFILLEFKCKDGSVIKPKSNVKEHCKDSACVIRATKNIKFADSMIKSYNLMCKIEGKPQVICSADEVEFKIGFLLTGNHYKLNNDNCIKPETNIEAISVIKSLSDITDKEKKNILWYWAEDYRTVEFLPENFTRLEDL